MTVPSLGSRGQGWVVLQFVLMAAILAAGFLAPGWPERGATALRVAGALLVAAGIALGVWAGRTLGRSLTPFPKPHAGAELVEAGPYGVVRHPIYTAGLAVFAGFGLATGPVALALAGLLACVWAMKSAVEERFLHDRYPGYEAYAGRVRSRLVPGVY